MNQTLLLPTQQNKKLRHFLAVGVNVLLQKHSRGEKKLTTIYAYIYLVYKVIFSCEKAKDPSPFSLIM
jgi:hypothetical protein